MKLLVILSALFFLQTAYAGPVAVVGSSSSIGSVSAGDLKLVFLGKSKTLAGKDVKIVIQGSNATHDAFVSNVTGKSASKFTSHWARLVFSGKAAAPSKAGSDADVKSFVGKNANGVGYIDSGSVDGSVKVIWK